MAAGIKCLLVYLCIYVFHLSRTDDTPEAIVQKPTFIPPTLPPNHYTAVYFASPSDLRKLLVVSEAKKDDTDEKIAKYDGIWSVEVPKSSAIDQDYALVLESKARHHAIAWKLRRPIKFDTKEIVIQYEAKFEDGIECAGAYIKLLSTSNNLKLELFNDKTPYTIMFGPDKCGTEHKYHFILRYKNRKTGQFEEKHAKKLSSDIDSYFTDKKTHLYTLVLRSDNTFTRYIDEKKVQTGNLLQDMEPPINPPVEIDDPNDERPADWDEREKIVDANAKKPDDWDESAPELITDESATKPAGWLDEEPEMIADPSAVQPVDWDPEMDGDWEAPQIKNPTCESAPGCGEWTKPQIPNPNYKGRWSAPLITNPAYKGKWQPAKIPNPNFFEDKEPFRNLAEVSALGLELWSMNENIVFDNFLIVDSAQEANVFAEKTWRVKQQAEQIADPRAKSVVDAIRENVQEKPWLSLVIGLACLLLVVFFCIYMCRSPSPSGAAAAAHHKKTDAHTPYDGEEVEVAGAGETEGEDDDEVVVGDDDDDEEEEEVNSTEDDVVDVAAGGDSSPVEEKKKGVAASGKVGQESDSADEQPAVTSVLEKQTARKRRSRKE